MQLSVTLAADRIRLPIATSQTVQGLIYRALSVDPRFSSHLHENGQVYDGRAFKLFTFGDLRGKYELEGKDTIVYLGEATLEIRSADAYAIQLLFTYFATHSEIRLGNNTVALKNPRLGDRHVDTDRIEIRTLSPITVYLTTEDRHTVYFAPDDERFCTAVESNARRKWCAAYGEDAPFSFRIRPVVNARFKRRATSFKGTYITAWHGDFILEGDPPVLDFLYQTGLGAKNSQGFGMFEVR